MKLDILQIGECFAELTTLISSEELSFFEYKSIPDERKKLYTLNKIHINIEKNENISFCVTSKKEIVAAVIIIKDLFDSGIFNLNIYRISNFWLFDNNQENFEKVISKIVAHLRTIALRQKQNSYFLLSLNTNKRDCSIVFNILLKNGFHFINTLLTYKMFKDEYLPNSFYSKSEIKIREVKKTDVSAIMDLARKSFKYSRFHMDPFLSKEKANTLLATSAKNSIIENYVDVMYVATINDFVVGYYSAKKTWISEFGINFGEAVISAVNGNYRDLGIFKSLNGVLLKWFSENVDLAEMGTYISNTPVHKTWSNNGLGIIRGNHQIALYISSQ